METINTLQKLVEYYNLLKRLNRLSRNGKPAHYDHVIVTFSPNIMITEHWSNTDNPLTRTFRFPMHDLDKIMKEINDKIDRIEKKRKANEL